MNNRWMWYMNEAIITKCNIWMRNTWIEGKKNS